MTATLDNLHKLVTRPWFPVVAFLVLAFAMYGVSLNAPPQFDDDGVFAKRSTQALVAQLQLPRRVLVNASFLANDLVHGKSMWGYHIVNVLIHALASLAVFQLVRLLRPDDRINRTAWLAGLIFIVHPLATQAVSYTCQRYSSMAAMFMLWTMVAYVAYRRSQEAGKPSTVFYVATFLLGIAAALSKEFVAVLPVLAVLLDLGVFGLRPQWRERAIALVPLAVCVLVLGTTLILSKPSKAEEGPVAAGEVSVTDWTAGRVPRKTYLLSQSKIFFTSYVRLMLAPFGQSIDHEFEATDELGLGEMSAILSIMLWGVCILLCLRRAPLVSLGLALILLNLLPTSSLVPNTEFIAEHRAYGSIAGFAIIVAAALSRLKVRFLWVAVIAYLCLLGGLTIRRNLLWNDELALWMDAHRKSRTIPRPAYAVGTTYLERKQFQLAEQFLREALKRRPTYRKAYTNLGLALEGQNKDRAARDTYLAVFRRWPDDVDGLFNVGRIYLKLGDLKRARIATEKALEYQPSHIGAQFALGQLLERESRPREALLVYRKLLSESLSPEQRQAATLLAGRAGKAARQQQSHE